MPCLRIGCSTSDDAVVEVDEHRPVGDYALLADRDSLVGGDRAVLPDHGLRTDLDPTLVAADLACRGRSRRSGPSERRHRARSEAAAWDRERPCRRSPDAGRRRSEIAAQRSARASGAYLASIIPFAARKPQRGDRPPLRGDRLDHGCGAGVALARCCRRGAHGADHTVARRRDAAIGGVTRLAAEPCNHPALDGNGHRTCGAAAERRQARPRARDHADRERRPRRDGSRRRGLPAHRLARGSSASPVRPGSARAP